MMNELRIHDEPASQLNFLTECEEQESPNDGDLNAIEGENGWL